MFSVPACGRGVNVRGVGNCFCRAVALAVDRKTDHAYPFSKLIEPCVMKY